MCPFPIDQHIISIYTYINVYKTLTLGVFLSLAKFLASYVGLSPLSLYSGSKRHSRFLGSFIPSPSCPVLLFALQTTLLLFYAFLSHTYKLLYRLVRMYVFFPSYCSDLWLSFFLPFIIHPVTSFHLFLILHFLHVVFLFLVPASFLTSQSTSLLNIFLSWIFYSPHRVLMPQDFGFKFRSKIKV